MKNEIKFPLMNFFIIDRNASLLVVLTVKVTYM